MAEEKSTRFSLNTLDWKKLSNDALLFSAVPISFYLIQVLGTIQQPNHMFAWIDFVPSNNTVIAIIAWLLNQILNTVRKYIA